MNKTQLFLAIFFLALALSAFPVSAQNCPHGLINDPAPGACGLYVDQDRDRICDLSETEKAAPPPVRNAPSINGKNDSLAEKGSESVPVVPGKPDYHMWEIALVLVLAYLFSLELVKRKELSMIGNRKIWNALLGVSFGVTAITSLVILLRLNYGITALSSLDLAYWHIEFGYVMILIGIFHTAWHWAYLKSYFRKKITEPPCSELKKKS